ncbi:helix-turn-helix domain-containing protein [Streptomyces yerevanensis]|uniref:helix-turn-helix domain-containing protein n=1 Tax=Streptomyces yerevanensis TaxID=66378 RepID=UPI00052569F7|nr:helix-turn-helix transcriptional regulator [Streptomyces yerevanensis]
MNEAIESATPALCRLQLGVELRRLRTDKGLTAAQVARRLYWAPSKLTRLETGDNGVVAPSDVIALCDLYSASPEERAVLEGYAVVTKTKKDWWQSPLYRPVIPPGFKAFLGLEAIATQLRTYEAEFVPGLLQTEAYVRVIHERAMAGLGPDEIDRLVEVRLTRQEVLRRTQSPLKLTAIVNESVLRRRVGNGQVMRGQLEHIAELADGLPNVRVQVVPFAAGAHPGMNGSFAVLHFREPLKPIVYLENLAAAGVTRKEDDVERYEEAFSDLQATAPGHRESLNLIHNALKEF